MTAQNIDEEVKALIAQDDIHQATERVIQTYGGQIFGYLQGISRDAETAHEVFQQFSMDLWKGLGKFQWRASLRTWLFTLARHAHARHMRGPKGRQDAHLDTHEEAALPGRWARTATELWRKTEAKDWLWEQVQSFETSDRELLVLRLVQHMNWKEIAAVTADSEMTGPELTKRAASLRKRFERLKEKLRKARDNFGTDDD